MSSQFSSSWKSSIQSRKQRKYISFAALHTKHKFLSAPLSKILRDKYDKRSIPIRKGDEVLVMRGNFRKKKGKITSVDLRNALVTLEGIQRTKKDGSKVNVYFRPSALQIQTLILEDGKRNKNIDSTKASKTISQQVKSKTSEKTQKDKGEKDASN